MCKMKERIKLNDYNIKKLGNLHNSLVDFVSKIEYRILDLEDRILDLEEYTDSLERQIKKLKCNEKKYKSVANAE